MCCGQTPRRPPPPPASPRARGPGGACKAFPFRAKPCAETAYVLPGAFPTGDALLHRGCHGAGEFRFGVEQGIIPGGHGNLHASFQRAQPAQRADDPVTARLEDRSTVGIAGRFSCDKAGREARVTATKGDVRKEDDMNMEIQIHATAESLDKRDRARLPLLLLNVEFGHLVAIKTGRSWYGWCDPAPSGHGMKG
jgi:hypothetical protein